MLLSYLSGELFAKVTLILSFLGMILPDRLQIAKLLGERPLPIVLGRSSICPIALTWR
jgi:hypothetical protein